LTKPRWDAFHFTELEPILRNLRVQRLIIAGLQTNVCVETTARTAMMRNFEVAVPEDAVSTDGIPLHVNALDAMRVLYIEVAPWRELVAPGAPWDRAFTTPRCERTEPGPPGLTFPGWRFSVDPGLFHSADPGMTILPWPDPGSSGRSRVVRSLRVSRCAS
jgi:Isochorismatase family